ncbi:baseplate assembly protein [Desulfovibrio sp. UCD-KL4C]|uniref:baseplate assembly protein n=1 Tax=Desulfovibrio sp. UCD-KL4C TaxID=2578120 RepID=UPI0025C351B2|nr:baseplate assembly protein [Desulfovibrio sp. UCD-KL4C]
MTAIYGQDIALDDDFQAKVAANGELVLTNGTDTGVQDIKLALFTYLGTLFYDVDHGSTMQDWIKEESTSTTRSAFCIEVTRCINTDPRVVPMSPNCKILSWNETGITASTSWRFIDETHPFNIIFEVGSDGKIKEVMADVNPR